MSSIGKSTLVSIFFETRRAGYEKASFLENVRGRSTEDVQRQLLVDLCGTVDWDKSKYAGKIRQMVGTLRVLVVVDDVGCEEHLAALAAGVGVSGGARGEEEEQGARWLRDRTGRQVMQNYVSTGGQVQLGLLNEMSSIVIILGHHAFDGAKK